MALLVHVRAGARRYRALLTLPGARAPLIASVAGSMPIGMFGLAILLLVRDATGSFADAGRVVGVFGLANALGAVAQGRLMDRLGQPRVLRVAGTGHLLALVVLVIAATRGAPLEALAACAAGAGACLPQVPSAMRSLWSALVDDEERRQTAYALVSIVFEVSVVTAPVLVAGIATVASPAAAVLVAAALGSGGAFAFAATRASRGWRAGAPSVGWAGPLAAAGMRALFAVLLLVGTAIGVVQVALPAFAAQHGSAEAGGFLLAALSAGSLAGGVVYGARAWPGPPGTRLAVLVLGLAAGCALLAAAAAPWSLAVVLLVIGLLLGPTTVVCSALLDTVAPEGTVTEAFAVMVMGLVAGTAAGNAVGGAIVEDGSYRTAALAAAAIAALGAVWAVGRRSALAASRRRGATV